MVALALAAEAGRKVAGELSSNLPWELANSKWAASLNPVIANPLMSGRLIKSVVLATGVNTINHGLQRALRGYLVVLKSANVTIYDSQLTNQTPDLTLILNASGAATVSLYVF